MSRFNTQSTGTKTINRAGGEAYQQSPKLELVSLLLTTFLNDKYYETANDTLNRLKGLIKNIDHKFAAKASIYARNEHGIRSITHVMAGELGLYAKGEVWKRRYYNKIVRRVDDITEILSYYLKMYGKPIPNSMKRGLADSFAKFDAYQLAKYRAEKKELSLVDALNMLHPKPSAKNEQALKDLINGTLKSKDTWESKLTQAGQKANTKEEKNELKEQAWKDLILGRKIGYFALLRNLRNIIEQAPELILQTCVMLTDEKLIRNSLVLPFRFVSALKEIQKISNSRDVIMALNTALDISCKNVPVFDGKTCVVLDESGSMSGLPIEIGSLFAAILIKSNNADLILFSNDARYRTLNPQDSVLTLQSQITQNLKYQGTNFHTPFLRMDKAYNRIIILSDMQGWMDYYGSSNISKTFASYKHGFDCDPFVYSWDLRGYGDMQFPERNVFCLAGWSEKVFDTMKFLEQDKQALINEIEKIEL